MKNACLPTLDASVKRRCLFRLLTGVAGLGLSLWTHSAPSQPRLKVRIGVAKLRAMQHLPLILAHELGFFRAEGLQAELFEFESEYLVLQALAQNKVDAGVANYATTLAQQVRGLESSAFLLLTRSPLVAMGVSLKTLPHYRDLQDLKGRRLGLLAPSPTGSLLATTLLQHAGLRLSDLVQVISHTTTDLLDQYRLGHIDALSVADPLITMLEQRGEIRVVADTRSLRGSRDIFGGDMPGEVLCSTLNFQRQQPLVCLALAHAMIRALKWLQTAGPSDLIKAIPDHHFDGDRGVYLTAFEKLRDGFSSDGVMSFEATLTALQTVARIDREVRPERLSLERTYTNEFVQKAKQKLRG